MSNSRNCCYNSLGDYYRNSIQTPILPTEDLGYYTVPKLHHIKYDALEGKGCDSYDSINTAYGANSDKCNQLYINLNCKHDQHHKPNHPHHHS